MTEPHSIAVLARHMTALSATRWLSTDALDQTSSSASPVLSSASVATSSAAANLVGLPLTEPDSWEDYQRRLLGDDPPISRAEATGGSCATLPFVTPGGLCEVGGQRGHHERLLPQRYRLTGWVPKRPLTGKHLTRVAGRVVCPGKPVSWACAARSPRTQVRNAESLHPSTGSAWAGERSRRRQPRTPTDPAGRAGSISCRRFPTSMPAVPSSVLQDVCLTHQARGRAVLARTANTVGHLRAL